MQALIFINTVLTIYIAYCQRANTLNIIALGKYLAMIEENRRKREDEQS